MALIENGPVTIHYQETGSGFPLLVLPGGGLNATIENLSDHPFNPLNTFNDTHNVIALDIRNANEGRTRGPLEIDRTWDAFTDDQLNLMNHLGFDQFIVMGFCIGGPMIWNLLKHARERVTAAVLVHPSGYISSHPNIFVDLNMRGWAPRLMEQRPEITTAMISEYLANMYTKRADFVFTVDREFVRNCEIPLLILPDDIPPHPHLTAMETALLAPNAQVSLYPWKENDRKVSLALNHIRSFLAANTPI